MDFPFSLDTQPRIHCCVGAEGYIARLAFWMLLPFVVIVVAIGIGAARIGCYLTI